MALGLLHHVRCQSRRRARGEVVYRHRPDEVGRFPVFFKVAQVATSTSARLVAVVNHFFHSIFHCFFFQMYNIAL